MAQCVEIKTPEGIFLSFSTFSYVIEVKINDNFFDNLCLIIKYIWPPKLAQCVEIKTPEGIFWAFSAFSYVIKGKINDKQAGLRQGQNPKSNWAEYSFP